MKPWNQCKGLKYVVQLWAFDTPTGELKGIAFHIDHVSLGVHRENDSFK